MNIGARNVTTGYDLLKGTTEFMDRAKQLDDDSVGDFWSDPKLQAEVDKRREFRLKLLREEWEEYLDAEDNDDLVNAIDGLLDVIVIAWGTLLDYVGEEAAVACASEVLWSNLDKVIGKGRPVFREDGKVLKPANWTGPNIQQVLRDRGFRV